MNIDCIRESVNLPILNKEDRVVIHNVGAYNMTQWMQFISRRPTVVLIDMNSDTHIIRQSEENSNIQDPEVIPRHLDIKNETLMQKAVD